MKVYIRAGILDKNHFQTSMDRSRAQHLSRLMDDQEWAEQQYYNESTDKYNRTLLINKYSKQLEDMFKNGVAEINNDVRDIIEEYDLAGKDIWSYISDCLLDTEFKQETDDGLTTRIYESDGILKVVLNSYYHEKTIAEFGLFYNDDPSAYGDPDAAELFVTTFNATDLCNAMYDVYSMQEVEFDADKIYNMCADYVLFLLEDIITRAVTEGINNCIDNNPSPLK